MRLTLEDLLPDRSQGRFVRPVTEADLPALKGPRGGTPLRKKLRYKHHVLARLLASGMQERTAAVVSGFAPVTVSILKKDPAFAELVKFYETEEGKRFDHVRAQVLGVGKKFIEEMERRVTAPKLTYEPEGRGHGPAATREFPLEGGGSIPGAAGGGPLAKV